MNTEFSPIDRIDNIYGDGIGYVELWPCWVGNISQEHREFVAATIATLSYGNNYAKNPKALYNLLKEKDHSSVFEFIVDATDADYSSNMRDDRFGSWKEMGFSDNDILEMCNNIKSKYALFKIKVPIFVVRQMFRHREMSALECSRRYVKASKKPFEFYRYEDDKEYYDFCVDKYNNELANGKRPEDARIYIPTAAYTEFFWMANYRPVSGLKNYFKRRLDTHSQSQIVTMTRAMYELIEKNQPELFNKIKLRD